jgi:hypothetical protein
MDMYLGQHISLSALYDVQKSSTPTRWSSEADPVFPRDPNSDDPGYTSSCRDTTTAFSLRGSCTAVIFDATSFAFSLEMHSYSAKSLTEIRFWKSSSSSSSVRPFNSGRKK